MKRGVTKMSWYEKLILVLAAIGAINWGLNEIGFNAVDKLITSWAGATIGSVIYILVGLCGIYALIKIFSK